MGEKQDSKTVMNLGPPTIIHFDVKTLWIYIYNYIAKHWGDQRTMDFTNGKDLMLWISVFQWYKSLKYMAYTKVNQNNPRTSLPNRVWLY